MAHIKDGDAGERSLDAATMAASLGGLHTVPEVAAVLAAIRASVEARVAEHRLTRGFFPPNVTIPREQWSREQHRAANQAFQAALNAADGAAMAMASLRRWHANVPMTEAGELAYSAVYWAGRCVAAHGEPDYADYAESSLADFRVFAVPTS